MLKEIATCSKEFAKFGFDIVYAVVSGAVLGKVIDNLIVRLGASVAIKKAIKECCVGLLGNRRFAPCIIKARANFRSQIEVDLLDLF